MVLLALVLLAGVGTLLAERLAPRGSAAPALLRDRRSSASRSPYPSPPLAPTVAVFVRRLAAYGVALGIVDASSNMQAVALEHRYGRPILPSFHGSWTLGDLVGAARPGHRAPAAATAALVAVRAARGPRRAVPRPRAQRRAAADVDVPWRPILLVGLAMVLFYMVDTAAHDLGTDVPRPRRGRPAGPGRARARSPTSSRAAGAAVG